MLQEKKEEQLKLQIEKDRFNELDVFIAAEILGYEIGQITPPYMKKKVQDLAKSYDYEVIRLCFEYLKRDLDYYLQNKEFTDEQHKVNYIMVVIKNNINDTYAIWKRKKEMERKKETFKIDSNIMDEISTQQIVHNKRDSILEFLDEEDY